MSEGRIDDEMIEISDPNVESAVVEPPFKVVIEYRERGVPWMLIPPLLILSAIGAVMGYHKLIKDQIPPRAIAVVPAPVVPEVGLVTEPASVEPTKVIEPPIVKVEVAPIVAVVPPANPVELPPSLPVVPAQPAEEPLPAIEAPPAPAAEKPVADPPQFPRLTGGVGFDPKALEAERKAEAPPADPALTPVARQDTPREPARPAIADPNNLPTEVDPELLPPDPRQAKVRQKEREAQAVKQIELDRVRFHNELREICRIARDDYIKEVIALSNRYGMQLDPNVKSEAIRHLGETGRYVGADRQTRIDVLRAVGFPETLVLEDIFDNFEKKRIGERNGPKNASEAMHRSILFLLRYAPGQRAATNRIVTTRPATTPPAPPAPAYFVNPGTR